MLSDITVHIAVCQMLLYTTVLSNVTAHIAVLSNVTVHIAVLSNVTVHIAVMSNVTVHIAVLSNLHFFYNTQPNPFLEISNFLRR